ncbi:MAG: epoxyalkane--coenzyme M transferase, partial [Alphaproteobacteria bacterium]
MKISTARILTTHVGSLPRPQDLLDLLRKEDRGEDVDKKTLHELTTETVKKVVAEQVANGIDVVCDGEMS